MDTTRDNDSTAASEDDLPVVQSYFNKEALSNIKIVFGEENLHAHRLKLAEGSPYFSRVLSGGFKSETPGELRLHDDDPAAVKGLIAWIYNLDFDGRSSYTNIDETAYIPQDSRQASEYAMYLAGLHAAAYKYEVHSLEENVAHIFSEILTIIIHNPSGEPDGTNLESVARRIFASGMHKEAVGALRYDLLQLYAANLATFSELRGFKQLLLDAPELAAELVGVLAQKEKDKATRRTEVTPGSRAGAKRPADTFEDHPTPPPNHRLPASTTMTANPAPGYLGSTTLGAHPELHRSLNQRGGRSNLRDAAPLGTAPARPNNFSTQPQTAGTLSASIPRSFGMPSQVGSNDAISPATSSPGNAQSGIFRGALREGRAGAQMQARRK